MEIPERKLGFPRSGVYFGRQEWLGAKMWENANLVLAFVYLNVDADVHRTTHDATRGRAA